MSKSLIAAGKILEVLKDLELDEIKKALKHVNISLEIELDTPLLNQQTNITTNEQKKDLSNISQYLEEKNPKNNIEALLVIAGFIEENEKKKRFTKKDLERVADESRHPVHKSVKKTIDSIRRKDWFNFFGGEYQLSGKGLKELRSMPKSKKN